MTAIPRDTQPENEHLHVRPLGEVPEAIPTLARWHFAQWGHLQPGDSVARRKERLLEHRRQGRIPATFVALLGGEPVGSASLVGGDLPLRPELGPWLASVFVAPAYRRRGIGAALVRRVEEEARRLGHDRLYLFTWDQERLYVGLGWEVRERLPWGGEEIVVMARDLV